MDSRVKVLGVFLLLILSRALGIDCEARRASWSRLCNFGVDCVIPKYSRDRKVPPGINLAQLGYSLSLRVQVVHCGRFDLSSVAGTKGSF